MASLVQGTDGNFYGITGFVDTGYDGTVFKITPTGSFSTLVSFNGSNGSSSPSCLVWGKDGHMYCTADGYPENTSIFKISPAGALANVASLNGTRAAITQGADGNLYGVINLVYQTNTTPTGSIFQISFKLCNIYIGLL